MDTSKKYIEICERAKEIQKLWKRKEGDFFIFPEEAPNVETGKQDVYVLGCHWEKCEGCEYESNRGIWLPRQDQLQETIEDDFNGVRDMTTWFDGFIHNDDCESSFEQLWLAFVMRQKWNKTWDGKKWVKVGVDTS